MPFNPPDEVARYADRPDSWLAPFYLEGHCQWDRPRRGRECDTPPRWISYRTGRERRFCLGHGRMLHRREDRAGRP